MSEEFYSYDVSTEYDDDQLHYHEGRHQEVPMGEVSKDLKGLSSSAAKDRKKGFFSRLFSSKPKEKGSHTPSLIKQMSQKTPNKTSTGKQRSQSAPRMKVSSWQEKTSTEHEKQQFRAMQQAARLERNVTPERRGSFDLEPYEDLGDVDVSPVSFYGSSFHQSMDDYHGPSLYDREVVVGGTKEPPPQPYYLQTYNQLMQQRNQQLQKFQQQKQHLQPPPFQQHQMHHNFVPQNAVRSTIQRSENNSGISTPTEENISRVNSHEVSGDPGLEDPAVQAFMEKRRMKKERSREDKLMREMLQEAAFMGVSPSKLVASDVSTVEEKSTTYPGRPYPDASQFHHVAPIQQQQQSRRPSQTGNYPIPPTGLMELASKSNDSYDRGLARSSDGPYAAHAQPKQRPLHPHEENQFYAPLQHQHHHPHHHQNPSSALLASRSNDSYDRPLPPPDALKSRPLPSQPVSPPLPVHDPVAPPVAPAPPVTTVPKATVALQQAPAPPVAAAAAPMTATAQPVSAATSAGVPVPDLPPHPLHDFVGIPKGVQFDTLHVMHHENAEILKIAAALLQKARRHPQLPKTDGIPREVAAAQLATMWLNQATFVRRRAGPEGASSSGKVSSSQGQGKPAMVPFPKAPLPRPADPAKARKDPSPTSKLPVNNASGGTTTSANSNGNAAMATSSGVPAAVASLTASPSAASPEQQRPAALPVETQVYQPHQQQQQQQPPPHHPSTASQPLLLPPQHFGAPLRSTKEAPHQSAPNVAYERQPSPAQLPPSQASQQYQAPSTPPPPLLSQPAAVSTIISHYEYLARSGSRDYTPDGGPGLPYLAPTALHDSPPGGQRAAGRKIMRVPVADDPVHQQPLQQQQQPQRRPSPMGMMRPEYARERAGSEGRLYEDVSRPGMMSRQTSTNNAPPPLLQQMSKRGYTQQQQQQQQMQNSYDAYDAPPTQYQQQQQPQYPVATGRGYDSYDVYDDDDEFAAAMAVPPLSSSSRNVSTSNAPSGYYAGGYSNGGAMNNGGAHPALHHHASSLSATSATSHMASTVVTANGSWVCKYCTLINDTTHSRCSACEAPRSKGPLIV